MSENKPEIITDINKMKEAKRNEAKRREEEQKLFEAIRKEQFNLCNLT